MCVCHPPTHSYVLILPTSVCFYPPTHHPFHPSTHLQTLTHPPTHPHKQGTVLSDATVEEAARVVLGLTHPPTHPLFHAATGRQVDLTRPLGEQVGGGRGGGGGGGGDRGGTIVHLVNRYERVPVEERVVYSVRVRVGEEEEEEEVVVVRGAWVGETVGGLLARVLNRVRELPPLPGGGGGGTGGGAGGGGLSSSFFSSRGGGGEEEIGRGGVLLFFLL